VAKGTGLVTVELARLVKLLSSLKKLTKQAVIVFVLITVSNHRCLRI
jgi:hypothetical protein